jgi:hypothetical protein
MKQVNCHVGFCQETKVLTVTMTLAALIALTQQSKRKKNKEATDTEHELDSEAEEPKDTLRELYREFGFCYKNNYPPALSSSSQPNPMANSCSSSSQSGSGQLQTSTSQPASSGTQTTVTMSMAMMGALGGETNEYNPNGVVTKTTEVFYKKTDREPMAPDKLAAFFDKASKPGLTTKCNLISLTFSDEDKLDNMYSIGILVNWFKAHCIKYDMHDVMNIAHLQPNKPSEPLGVASNLFKKYSKVLELTLAESCKWFQK